MQLVCIFGFLRFRECIFLLIHIICVLCIAAIFHMLVMPFNFVLGSHHLHFQNNQWLL